MTLPGRHHVAHCERSSVSSAEESACKFSICRVSNPDGGTHSREPFITRARSSGFSHNKEQRKRTKVESRSVGRLLSRSWHDILKSCIDLETQTHTGLRPGRCARIVVTRLLRFWEARNAKKGGELMGVDMLLLDDQSSLIQASVPVHRLNTFRELLREGAMYELSGFDVSRSNNHFKLFDSVVAIWLNEFTKMVEVPAVANHIPTEMFRFRSVEQLMSLANTNVELPDIIGEVSDIRTTYNDHTQTTQRVMVNIRVDNVAELLHKRLEHGVVQPKVMVDFISMLPLGLIFILTMRWQKASVYLRSIYLISHSFKDDVYTCVYPLSDNRPLIGCLPNPTVTPQVGSLPVDCMRNQPIYSMRL
ncbi:hypothetical protein YC2023_051429 [Brassica napus]